MGQFHEIERNRRSEEEKCSGVGGTQIGKTVGIKKFIAMSREGERGGERERENGRSDADM